MEEYWKMTNYLYPVHQLSETFKGKFLSQYEANSVKKLEAEAYFKSQIEKAYQSKWVVYSEAYPWPMLRM